MDELTAEQTAELRRDLLALREQIASELESSRDNVRPVELDQPIGRLSRMDAIQQQKMAQATRQGAP